MLRNLIFLCLIVFQLMVLNAEADLQETKDELRKIQQRIESAQSDLRNKRKSELKFSRELAVLNRTLQRIDQRISVLKSEQKVLLGQINKKKQQVADGKHTLRKVRKQLDRRLVALYKDGEVGPLKILFSADTPTELVQQYHYLTRVAENDRELLDEYRLAIAAHQKVLDDLEQLNHKKSSLVDREQQQRQVAADGRKVQSRLLKKVKSEKSHLKTELAQLKEKAGRLQGLVARLREQRTGVETPSIPRAKSFVAGKGKLGWPVNGNVLIGFGTQKDRSLGTYYESNGLEITAAPGTSIQAVADGKVVFADWFKGYGNLMIVSHPGGFHTLYAQAAELGKSVGTQVKAGEVLGKTGLGGRDSIYFEIRDNGSPVNPIKWLQRR